MVILILVFHTTLFKANKILFVTVKLFGKTSNKKIPSRKKWDFNFVTGTGQISINFMEDLKRLAY
jgi:hypothetical protein